MRESGIRIRPLRAIGIVPQCRGMEYPMSGRAREPPLHAPHCRVMKTNYSKSGVRLHILGASLMAASMAAAGFAQTQVRDPNPPARDVRGGAVELKRHDRDFFQKAAKTSMEEV